MMMIVRRVEGDGCEGRKVCVKQSGGELYAFYLEAIPMTP